MFEVRVGVVDIGTNSTRLLVADVDDGGVREVDRRTRITRLGDGVDTTGRLGEEPVKRVLATLDEYREAITKHGCDTTTGVLTSAVRDAANGAEFASRVRADYELDARTIDGDTEARLTFLGATVERDEGVREPLVVIDIGGGSTELVVGEAGEVSFHVSAQAGVVRHTERRLHTDPPDRTELEQLSRDVRRILEETVPAPVRRVPRSAIGVAGTATSCAAIDLQLQPYDAARVEGRRLSRETLEDQLAELASLPVAARREVTGLHPDRAPTIVAGVAILLEALQLFGLDEVSISEHDVLWGAAIERARAG